MSKNIFEKIKCPNCGNQEDFRIWESVNTELNPELAQKVKDRSLFKFVCSKCKNDYEIEYTTLYHDPKLRFMVYYFSNEPKDNINTIQRNHLFSTDVLKDYKLRMVDTKQKLIEKIKIFEDGLDDIIIEILKGLCIINIPAEKKEALKAIYYYGKEDEKITLLVMYNGIQNEYARVSIKEYDNLVKDIETKQPKVFSLVESNNISNYIIKDNRPDNEKIKEETPSPTKENKQEENENIDNDEDGEVDSDEDEEFDDEDEDNIANDEDDDLIMSNDGEAKIKELINTYYTKFLEIARKSDIITNAEFEIYPFLCSIIDLIIEQANINTTVIREHIYPSIMNEKKWNENQQKAFNERIYLYDEMIMGKNPRAIWLNGNTNLNMKEEKMKCLVTFGDILYNPECSKDYYNAPIRLYGVFESINFTNQVIFPMIELLNKYTTDILNFVDSQDE